MLNSCARLVRLSRTAADTWSRCVSSCSAWYCATTALSTCGAQGQGQGRVHVVPSCEAGVAAALALAPKELQPYPKLAHMLLDTLYPKAPGAPHCRWTAARAHPSRCPGSAHCEGSHSSVASAQQCGPVAQRAATASRRLPLCRYVGQLTGQQSKLWPRSTACWATPEHAPSTHPEDLGQLLHIRLGQHTQRDVHHLQICRAARRGQAAQRAPMSTCCLSLACFSSAAQLCPLAAPPTHTATSPSSSPHCFS